MKTQWKILLFIVCLNLSIGLLYATQDGESVFHVGGTEYVGQTQAPTNSSEYESHFNATDTVGGWQSNIIVGIPIIGDIFSGLNFLWTNIKYLVDGFPMLLTFIKDAYITDYPAQLAFDVIANALRALFAIMMTLFAIEFISGRIATD